MEYVLIYAALGFATFGHRWHKAQIRDGFDRELDEIGRFATSFLAGMFFWAYWPGLAAIFLMQPRKKETLK